MPFLRGALALAFLVIFSPPLMAFAEPLSLASTSCTVTFVDYDGTVLATQSVNSGDAATAPATPNRQGYSFAGWDTGFTNVTTDLIVRATYEQLVYSVSFAPGNHGTSPAQTFDFIPYGSATPSPPLFNAESGWRFIGWQPALIPIVTANATYTALWEPAAILLDPELPPPPPAPTAPVEQPPVIINVLPSEPVTSPDSYTTTPPLSSLTGSGGQRGGSGAGPSAGETPDDTISQSDEQTPLAPGINDAQTRDAALWMVSVLMLFVVGGFAVLWAIVRNSNDEQVETTAE
ncbi:MAG: InlB B-repeat-containing protein [Coriobacteriales bacterium]|nr:InlB B-repeat-containing protein [Coriobacteriales bacterium]